MPHISINASVETVVSAYLARAIADACEKEAPKLGVTVDDFTFLEGMSGTAKRLDGRSTLVIYLHGLYLREERTKEVNDKACLAMAHAAWNYCDTHYNTRFDIVEVTTASMGVTDGSAAIALDESGALVIPD